MWLTYHRERIVRRSSNLLPCRAVRPSSRADRTAASPDRGACRKFR